MGSINAESPLSILLTLAYDGTNYAGWQRQENALAVQQVLEEALAKLLGQSIIVRAASRTDAGVHALGQRVAFVAEHMPIPIDRLAQVLNTYLPADIVLQAACFVEKDFNPRFRAKSKTYSYQIYNAPLANPLQSRYSAFVPKALNVEKMSLAAAHFIGRHDFAAFCAAGSSAKTTVRRIFSCAVEQEGSLVRMTVSGDAFLYNMVRIIAGTILYVGMGKLQPGDVETIIASKDRSKAGKTMPPEGLCLEEIVYEEEL